MSLEFSDELLSAYLDGELSPAERARVESHLAADPDARQLVEELRALSADVRELPRYAAGEHFSQRVVQAAQAAKSSQNGEVMPASLTGTQSLPYKVRRGRRLPVVLAGVAAVAAAVAMLAWFANRPPTGAGGGTIVKAPGSVDPGVSPKPADASAVEKALARLRQAIPQEGEGLVVRLHIGPGVTATEALDAAFAAAGLGVRKADDDTTGALRFANDYQNKLAEKIAGQPADATLAAADAVFVTAPLDQLEKALAAVASRPQSALEISPLMSGKVVVEAPEAGEEPGAAGALPQNFVQRLAALKFRLEKSGLPLAEMAPPLGPHDPAKPVRVLILVEP